MEASRAGVRARRDIAPAARGKRARRSGADRGRATLQIAKGRVCTICDRGSTQLAAACHAALRYPVGGDEVAS
jgi:hypothetical protein